MHPHGWDAAGWLAMVHRQEGEINRLRGLLESERARDDEANAVIAERARDLASEMERANRCLGASCPRNRTHRFDLAKGR